MAIRQIPRTNASPAMPHRKLRLPSLGSPAAQKSASPASAKKKTTPKATWATVGLFGCHSLSLFGYQFTFVAYGLRLEHIRAAMRAHGRCAGVPQEGSDKAC